MHNSTDMHLLVPGNVPTEKFFITAIKKGEINGKRKEARK